jgi:medium-chain acyl-[acyl-carrier-protein] hydrolase
MEQPFTRMETLAAELVTVLAPLLDVPSAFFGHSLGAAAAFEIAWRLSVHHGLRPASLFVSARRAPHLSSSSGAIHLLPEPEFKQKLRELGGTPEEALNNRELLDLILPILRADFELNDTFVIRPDRPPLACPVYAFGGRGDTEVAEADLDAWRHVTSCEFRLRMFDGGHFFLRENLGVIVRDICQQASV